ncbi:melanoregulin [Carcharodon carcharias]|uniref:melanoregulin n=1 Tax=Carcharodon carcharias TaxID=13397 RepID=UPI001B7EC974|nr:melanoregulin [Carcharodon carcharias]
MGDRNVFYRICCSCCGEDEPEEKTPIISDTLLYFAQEAQRRRSEQANLWSEPHDAFHTERDDDRELYNLLQKRAKTRRGSQGYRRLSFDIHAVRQERRDVLGKWKMILENLGFHAESDMLLNVTSATSYSSMRNAPQAKKLLDILAQETSIFDNKMPAERYIFVLDRLITLDAAEDFLRKAKNYYPRDQSPEMETEEQDSVVVLIKRTNEINPVTDEELEEVDEEILLSRSLEL